ncbi:hypothetical protein BTVI_106587 [Pitangus sulphuratus]|nr:hypothetical protein BTVI_106587 [Pitangus sulphuratus]
MVKGLEGKLDEEWLRSAFNLLSPQPVLMPEIALSQVKDFSLDLVEPHEFHMGSLLELVQVSLDGIPSLRQVNCTTQLGVVYSLAQTALDPTV